MVLVKSSDGELVNVTLAVKIRISGDSIQALYESGRIETISKLIDKAGAQEAFDQIEQALRNENFIVDLSAMSAAARSEHPTGAVPISMADMVHGVNFKKK